MRGQGRGGVHGRRPPGPAAPFLGVGPTGCLPGPRHDPLCSREAALLVTPLSHVPLQGQGPGPAPAAPPPARGLPKEGQPCPSGVSRPQGSCLQPPNYISDPTEGPSWESITGTGPHRGGRVRGVPAAPRPGSPDTGVTLISCFPRKTLVPRALTAPCCPGTPPGLCGPLLGLGLNRPEPQLSVIPGYAPLCCSDFKVKSTRDEPKSSQP